MQDKFFFNIANSIFLGSAGIKDVKLRIRRAFLMRGPVMLTTEGFSASAEVTLITSPRPCRHGTRVLYHLTTSSHHLNQILAE